METGALFRPDGSCLFRVFAPEARFVTLELPRRGEARALSRGTGAEEGYWSSAFGDISHGEPYLFRPGGDRSYPDPASRHQPEGVHGPSAAWDQGLFAWTDGGWRGIPREDLIFYEMHAGTFTPEGTLDAAIGRLDHLVDLGITALEVMPVNAFPGRRGWGYDGAYPYAVHAPYGGPDAFKRLVDACHARGLAVFLDVVYNHLGPEGNYLAAFGPYFTDRHRTPWGRAINFDGPDHVPVREFFIRNALHWLRDYHLDGLRLDAVHEIHDESARPFLAELSERVEAFSRRDGRLRLLIAESDLNDDKVLRGRDQGGFALHGQWLDDFHHGLDALLHPATSNYRRSFGRTSQLAKAYRECFIYSGEYDPVRRMPWGRPSAHRPSGEFVAFIQNHDQVGNRMTGDRLTSLVGFEEAKLAAAALLLSPFVPLLFMGEEYGESNPFLFFADYGDPALVEAVREGRKREFRHHPDDPEPPDPMAEGTFAASRLDWSRPAAGRHRTLLAFYQALIRLRKSHPALARPDRGNMEVTECGAALLLRRRDPALPAVPDSGLAVFLNPSGAAVAWPAPLPAGTWDRVFDSAATEWDGPGGTAPAALEEGRSLMLGAFQAVIYLARNSS
jgi:maltooligosyltrehalose trehalohydrolase